ncbi:hypothetical protein H0H87_010383 [Tephrocybe sp. NHM501043]|nr:hypothetical protein H0H87_012709 [Tephrocybe sp. NHM501043]KAG6855834.1 hypothetical protein H0H87_010383 [Tephrocybe sp. NHM501043]
MSSQNQRLAAGDILLTAFAGSTEPHYTLSIMTSPETCMKYHATNVSTGHFIFEAKPQYLLASLTLCVVLKIGTTRGISTEQITPLLESIPMNLTQYDLRTEAYFDCRVWLKQAVRVLASRGIITCIDADAVVNGELRTYALDNYNAIIQGYGRSKSYVSTYSA